MTGSWKDGGYSRHRYFVRRSTARAMRAMRTLLEQKVTPQRIAECSEELIVLCEWLRGTPEDADKRYFVLRYDSADGSPADPTARHALSVYAEAMQFLNEKLSQDLFDELRRTAPPTTTIEGEPTLPSRIAPDTGIRDYLRSRGVAEDLAEQVEAQVRGEPAEPESLRNELASALNRHGAESGSNTPDFILARYLTDCLAAFDRAVARRADWYGRMDRPGA